jgi:hypothetical protein
LCFAFSLSGNFLGRQFFVTPSDSLAIIAAHAEIIPFFAQQGEETMDYPRKYGL